MPSSRGSADVVYVGSRYIPDVDHITIYPEHETKDIEEEVEEEDGIPRGKFGRAAEFLITSLGFAVGLGNVWRFPNKVYSNGGAVFLIPYGLAIIFLAIPLQLLEASIGQYSKKGPVGVWDTVPMLRGVGWATFYSTSIAIIYYNTPISWACYYFVRSMASVLPWSTCDASWAVDPCITPDSPYLNVSTNTTSPTMFFYRENLHISEDLLITGDFVWPLFVANLILWLILFACTAFGASSLGKVAYFTSLFPYVMLTVMIGFTSTLPGSLKGVEFYLAKVDWNKLKEISVWRDAVSQVFYSTNCGFGAAIQLASYNSFSHHILRDTTLLPILDGLTSIFAGFSVFTVLGYMAHTRGVDVSDVAESGPSLIFITYAEAFSKISGGNVWAVFFFFMVILLGISSQIPVLEMCCGVISDQFKWFRVSRARNLAMRAGVTLFGIVTSSVFFIGCGYYWYFLIDEMVAAIPLMIIGLFELIGIAWIYSRPFCSKSGHKLLNNIGEMIGELGVTRWFFIICWTFIAPLTLVFILVFDIATFPPLILERYPWNLTEPTGQYVMPEWSIQLGWGLIAVCPAIVVVYIIYVVFYEYNGYKAVILATTPNKWVGADSRVQSRANTTTMPNYNNTKPSDAPDWVQPQPISSELINTHLNDTDKLALKHRTVVKFPKTGLENIAYIEDTNF